MSRQKNLRKMNYCDDDDYYDDDYEDDYGVSPGGEEYVFDRNHQATKASLFNQSDENREEDSPGRTAEKQELSEINMAKLVSCKEIIRSVIGDTASDADLTDEIIKADFNAEVALDAILKAQSEKSESGAAKAAPMKNRTDSQTDSSPRSSLRFTNSLASTPKFSLFQNKSFHNPSSQNSPKPTGATPAPLKFTSLSDLIASHSKTAPTSETPVLKIEKKSFSTLADLTSSHLQNNTTASKPSSFLIPKLSLKSGNKNHSSNLIIPPLKLKENDESRMEIEESVSSVQKELGKFSISPKLSLTRSEFSLKPNSMNISDNTNSINNSKLNFTNASNSEDDSMNNLENCLTSNLKLNEQTSNILINNVKSELTESGATENSEKPGENALSIDLSKVIKETRDITLNDPRRNKLIKYEMKDIYVMTAEPIPSSMMECLDNLKQCALNLSPLRKAKLAHASTSVSLFGRTLCRKWKLRKPYVKREARFYGKIKAFDFASPSPDTIILTNLGRK